MPLVATSFTAHLAVTNGNSDNQWELSYPRSRTCVAGGSSGTTLVNIRAGQRVIDREFIPYSCPGVVSGSIGYMPNTGPAGFNGPNGVPGRDGSILVGRFSFTMP